MSEKKIVVPVKPTSVYEERSLRCPKPSSPKPQVPPPKK